MTSSKSCPKMPVAMAVHHIDDKYFDGLKGGTGGVFVEEGVEHHQQEEGEGNVVEEGEECRKDRLVDGLGKRQPIQIDRDEERADEERTVG